MKRPMSYVAVSSALAVLVGSAWVTQAPPALAGTPAVEILLASQLVRWYADPGTIVEVRANKSFTENSFVHATISGYLVECQRRS